MEWWDFVWFIPILFMTGILLQLFVLSPITPAPAAFAPALGPTRDPRDYKPESWCFVGENTLGRYCVQSAQCGPMDRFPSREECEYTEASALPLGVTGEGGLYHNPFLQPRSKYYHTF